MNYIARLVSLSVLLVLIIFLGITFYKVITPYLMPLFLAAITAVLCQPLFHFFLKKSKGNTRSSARLTTLLIITLVMLPLIGGVAIAANQMMNMDFKPNPESLNTVRDKLQLRDWMLTFNEWSDSFSHLMDEPETVPPSEEQPEQPTPSETTTPPAEDSKDKEPSSEEPVEENSEPKVPEELVKKADEKLDEMGDRLHEGLTAILQDIGQKSLDFAVGIFSGIASILISILIFILALYYFLADGPALLEGTQKLIPVQMDYQIQLLNEFEKVVRAIILATMAAAIAQGLSTAGVMWMLGSGHFFLFFALSTMFAMIPMLGTWIVWAPFAIYLFLEERYFAGIFLALFGSIVIGLMDNFIRTIILKNDAKLHPLLAFVSVLGGLQALGLWGIFIGPTVAACLYALIKIFNLELKSLSEMQFGTLATQTASGPPTQADSQTPTTPADVTKDNVTTEPENKKPNQPESNE